MPTLVRSSMFSSVLLSSETGKWHSALRAADAAFQIFTVTKHSVRCFMVDKIQEEASIVD